MAGKRGENNGALMGGPWEGSQGETDQAPSLNQGSQVKCWLCHSHCVGPRHGPGPSAPSFFICMGTVELCPVKHEHRLQQGWVSLPTQASTEVGRESYHCAEATCVCVGMLT